TLLLRRFIAVERLVRSYVLYRTAESLLMWNFESAGHQRDKLYFPTRRSSDLHKRIIAERDKGTAVLIVSTELDEVNAIGTAVPFDRKSTRLNCSHVKTAYAVSCAEKQSASTAAAVSVASAWTAVADSKTWSSR